MTRVPDVPSARRLAAALLADVVKSLEADPPADVSTNYRRTAFGAWYRDTANDLVWLYSDAAAMWCDMVGLDVDVLRHECERRGFVRDPWSDVSADVKAAVGGRPTILDDPERERLLLRFLRRLDQREAA